MSVVSVSKESLQRVKTALREFQTNVETSTEHIKSHAEEIVTSTCSSIKKQQALVESLENKVALLSSEIEQCQAQIICNSNQINSLKDNIADVSSRISSLDGRIVQLDMQKQRLSASSSSADHCNDNSNQIYAIEHQIQSCENQRRQLDNQLSSMRNQENSLNCQNAKLHAEKSRMDAALIMTKKELNEACEKSEKMKNAGAAVESSLSNFLNVALQFRQTAILTSNSNKSGIDKCIAAAEEYEAMNLSHGEAIMPMAFSSYKQRLKRTPKDLERWETGVRGEGLCTTDDSDANAILIAYGLRGVTYQNAIPDFAPFAVYTVEIGNMFDDRENRNSELGGTIGSYLRADMALATQLNWSVREVQKFRKSHIPELTWHERNDTHTMDLIPRVINNCFSHYGGIAESAAIRRESHSADDILDTISDITQNIMDYNENQEIHDIAMEETPPISCGPIDEHF